MPVANARMYSTTPEVKEGWRTLLAWVLKQADLAWDVIDYDAPAPLSLLWARNDLGMVMMCGMPYARRSPRPLMVAAPVPMPHRYARRPVYFTDIVVRADAPFRHLEDTFGGVVGYTLADSLSGGVALAHHLKGYRTAGRDRLYRKSVGNLIHARGVIEALAQGSIDVGPLDSYYHDLLRHNDPMFAAQVRTVASTAPLPIPPLVATAPMSEEACARLRTALSAVEAAPDLAALRGMLQLAAFAFPDPADYAPLGRLPEQLTTSFEEL